MGKESVVKCMFVCTNIYILYEAQGISIPIFFWAVPQVLLRTAIRDHQIFGRRSPGIGIRHVVVSPRCCGFQHWKLGSVRQYTLIIDMGHV